jgi:lysine 2,3-aminomutase
LLRYLKRKNLELQARGKRMEVATHFIHPDEISPQSLSIITDLVRKRYCRIRSDAVSERLQR